MEDHPELVPLLTVAGARGRNRIERRVRRRGCTARSARASRGHGRALGAARRPAASARRRPHGHALAKNLRLHRHLWPVADGRAAGDQEGSGSKAGPCVVWPFVARSSVDCASTEIRTVLREELGVDVSMRELFAGRGVILMKLDDDDALSAPRSIRHDHHGPRLIGGGSAGLSGHAAPWTGGD